MKGIVDRFEEAYVIVEIERKGMKNIPLEWFPKGVKEGDCVIVDSHKKRCTIDAAETNARHQQIKNLMDDLFKD